MKLTLISPLASKSLLGGDFFFRLPSLGLLKVAAATPPEWEVSIIDEKAERLPDDIDADLVGITAMTPAVKRGYEIADTLRSKGKTVVMGGMHASKLPQEALNHVDAVVIGEAEGIWPRLLTDFKRGSLKKIYQHENGYPALDKLSIVNWNLYKGKRYLPVHFVETTRGCPFNCEFCSVTSSFGGRFRNRPVDEVEREIQSLKPFEQRFILKNTVFFVDDNIIGNRAHAKEMLTRIKPYNLKWLGQASSNIAKDAELLKLCKDSGCMGLLVGFESLSKANLSKMGKGFNKPDDYVEIVKRFHEHGLGIDGAFVFGFDDDDEDVFDRTIEFTIRAKLDVCYFSILTPYPGTRLYEQMEAEGRIIERDWSYYNTNNVVFKPKLLSPQRLLSGYYKALKEAYSYPNIVRRLWGNGSYKNFFYPMNFGFRQSINKTTRRGQDFNVPENIKNVGG
ncbi:MAG: B12-binding domain-containing radical SAM protein [Nitrospirae bacterium]|nr:B12-binding domain-containing radical SAM protein [Nitrospirota bacterium]